MKHTIRTLKQAAILIMSLTLGAQAQTLPEALGAADNRTDVINAQLAYTDATIALSRTQADPLALRLEQTQAQQRATLSSAQLTQARYQAQVDITSAYTQLLEAQAQTNLAQQARDLSVQALDIARIRFDKGSATALDVQEAENSLEDAENTLMIASQGLALAKNNLESLIGMPVDAAQPVPEVLLSELPPLEQVLANLGNLPTLVQVKNGADLAQLGYELLDPSYASQSQIDNAQLQASQAQESAKEAQRGLEIQARSLYNNAQSARETLVIRQSALDNALEREALEKQRLDAGLIAEINFKQTQLATQQARIGALQARHAYLNALLTLQAGTMTPLDGLNGTPTPESSDDASSNE